MYPLYTLGYVRLPGDGVKPGHSEREAVTDSAKIGGDLVEDEGIVFS